MFDLNLKWVPWQQWNHEAFCTWNIMIFPSILPQRQSEVYIIRHFVLFVALITFTCSLHPFLLLVSLSQGFLGNSTWVEVERTEKKKKKPTWTLSYSLFASCRSHYSFKHVLLAKLKLKSICLDYCCASKELFLSTTTGNSVQNNK